MLNTFELQQVEELITDNTIFSTKEVLTSDEAARYLGISKSYLYKLTIKQVIPHYKPMGKMCYFNRVELERWLQNNRVATSDNDAYATITVKLYKEGVHAYCEEINKDCFGTNGNLKPLVKLIQDAEICCNPDTRFSLAKKSKREAKRP